MFGKRYIVLYSSLLFARIFAGDNYAASCSMVIGHTVVEPEPYMTEMRFTPYEGISTPFYATEENFTRTLRSGDAPALQAMLEAFPTLVHRRYKGNISPLHIICAMEHFNKKYNVREMINIFFEATNKQNLSIRKLVEEDGMVATRTFHQLCTGEQLAKHALLVRYRPPIVIAASYPNIETLKALLEQSAIRYFSMHELIIDDPFFNTYFDLYRHLIRHRQVTRGPGFDRGSEKICSIFLTNGEYQYTWNESILLISIIKATIQKFGVRGIQMLHDEGVIVASIEDEFVQELLHVTLDAFGKEFPGEKERIAHLKATPKPGAFSTLYGYYEHAKSLFMSTVPNNEPADVATRVVTTDGVVDNASQAASSVPIAEPFAENEV